MKILIAVISLYIFQLINLQIASASENDYPIEFVSQSPHLKLSKVSVQQNQQLILTGKIKRISKNVHIAPGHLEVIVFNLNNQAIIKKSVNYSPALLSKHNKFGSQFEMVLPDDLPKGSSIKIKWHSNQSENSF
jgi:hypothetical protein